MEFKLCHCRHHVIKSEYTTVHAEGEYFDRYYCKKHYMQLAEKAIANYKMSLIDTIKYLLFGKPVLGELKF
jgi:hypothetical protein